MDEDDQNSLAGFDLDAWAPPAVAPRFADRVIARVATTDRAIAAEVSRRSTRRWRYGTAIAAILAAAAAILVWLMPDRPEPQSPASGTIVAVRPQRLVLDRASADLDVGTYVSWSHVGGAVTVAQRSGGATWHVDANQHLEIKLAQTSIEASDATLRLETNMNLADGKILGAAAIAAASLITMIVYEGHVQTTNDSGQTMTVASGGVLASRDGQEVYVTLAPSVTSPEDLAFAVTIGKPGTVKRVIVSQTARGDLAEVLVEPGESPKIHDRAAAVSVAIKPPTCDHDTVETAFETPAVLEHDAYSNMILKRGLYRYTVRCTHGTNIERGVINVVADEGQALAGMPAGVARNVVPDVTATRFESDTMGLHFLIKRTPHLPKQLDQNDIRMAMQTAESTLMGRCAIKAKMDASFTVLPSGKVEGVIVNGGGRNDARVAECIEGIISMMQFPKAQTSVAVTYPISPPPPPCDAENLVEAGTQSEARGDHVRALDALEKAYACKPEIHTLQLTFMAACNASKVPTARKFWKLMAADTQNHVEMICTRNHITREMLDAK